MIVIGTDLVERYLRDHSGHKGMKAARTQYMAWLGIAEHSRWMRSADMKTSHPKASILKGGRVVFNIKGNDFRLVVRIDYGTGVVQVRFFGSHSEYDQIDAETV